MEIATIAMRRLVLWNTRNPEPVELSMTPDERLAAIRDRPLQDSPEDDAARRARALATAMVADLVARGSARTALGAGDRAPPFTLCDAAGRRRSLAALLVDGPLVLSFFRGDWCPYCREDLAALRGAAELIRGAGGVPVAISPQRSAVNAATVRRFGLDFPVLSDPGNVIADAFGLRFAMPEALVALYRERFATDFAAVNGDDSGTLPMPATFVIGRDQRIRYAELNPDYTRRTDVPTLIPVVRRFAGVQKGTAKHKVLACSPL